MSEKRWTATLVKRKPAGHPIESPDVWRRAAGQRVTIDRAERALSYMWGCPTERVYRVAIGTQARLSPNSSGRYICECLLTRTDRERLRESVPISPKMSYDPRRDGNLVEWLAGEEEGGGQNQPCRHGNLVVGHAVYCHNTNWKDAPRKCRRTWYTGGETRDEDCEGFAPNPAYVRPTE